MDYKLLKTYKSRKNKVELIYEKENEMKMVRKEYLYSESAKKKETDILRVLMKYNVKVPEIIRESENIIYMTYIDDMTLLDYFLFVEKDSIIRKDESIINIFIKVFSWLKQYYYITYQNMGKKLILYDINFRNFLIKDGMVYGIDFEDSIVGTKEMDGGRFCAYMLTYEPIFTEWKINITLKVMDLLVYDFGYDKGSLLSETKKELNNINNRRWNGYKMREIEDINRLLGRHAK